MFRDRIEAGHLLGVQAQWALERTGDHDVVVAGLPRGGVPVAAEVARVLNAPLDVVIVRKLGLPGQPEVAMGALAEDGVEVVDPALLRRVGVTAAEVAEVVRAERAALLVRVERMRTRRPRPSFAGRTVVVVDDGIATGATARAACLVARARGAARVVLAAPVVIGGCTAADLGADALVSIAAPTHLVAVSQAYQDFRPVPDREVDRLLDAVRADGLTA